MGSGSSADLSRGACHHLSIREGLLAREPVVNSFAEKASQMNERKRMLEQRWTDGFQTRMMLSEIRLSKGPDSQRAPAGGFGLFRAGIS